jgi:D-glycero-D-manno-heptose 1,7-bisphosphate phosphatase
MKLIILDRDGVINYDRDDYVKSADECIAIEGSVDAIVRLSKAGFTVVVATNQAGLAKGMFELEDLEGIHDKITRLVEDQGGELGGIFYCPHHPEDNCKCRKPKTGLLDAIEAEFNTSVESCYFIGDSLRDLQAAIQKACKPVLVLTGNGVRTHTQLMVPGLQTVLPMVDIDQVQVFENLAAAATFVINESK